MSNSYKNTCNKSYWSNFLGRRLTIDEKFILDDVITEKIQNDKLLNLSKHASKFGLYVNELTEMYGNCLFESLKYVGFYDDETELRRGIALLMLMVADVNLHEMFECSEILGSTPREIFNLTNEIEYVYCKKAEKLYKYTYETMCKDIYGKYSWNRLHTELILRVMACVFNLEFKIFHNAKTPENPNYITILKPTSSIPIFKTINLGLIGEFHYVPLVEMETPDKILKYRCSSNTFHKWARKMADEKERKDEDMLMKWEREWEKKEIEDGPEYNKKKSSNIHFFEKTFSNMDISENDIKNLMCFN